MSPPDQPVPRVPLGLALSGGGSRAMAFHLGCLRALHELGLLSKVKVLSTISGGSVIGAYYAYTPEKSFDEFETDIRLCLQLGFQGMIVGELLKPHHLVPGMVSFGVAQVQEALMLISRAVGQGKFQPPLSRFCSRTDMFQKVLERELFTGLALNSPRRADLKTIIGACELRYGEAFRFSDGLSGGWRYGAMVAGNVPLAFAVAASAAYPVALPAFDRTWEFDNDGRRSRQRVALTDGGVYDNLGVQLLEPDGVKAYDMHLSPCDNLIVCNAGHGQESGESIPMGYPTRVGQSFSVVHRRVQDGAMKRLHAAREAGRIRAFAMPYLGQQDAKLPRPIAGLITREEVIGYPTDFKAMRVEQIKKISGRGEQLTRALVIHYLPHLL